MSDITDTNLSLAEGVLRAAVRQGQDAFRVDPTFIADVIAELRRFRSCESPTAIAAEREACAKIAEKLAGADVVYPEGIQMIAAAIRARGE